MELIEERNIEGVVVVVDGGTRRQKGDCCELKRGW